MMESGFGSDCKKKSSEFGYITEIFSSTDGEDVGNYSLGESSILRIPNYDEFSGICFLQQ